MVFSSLAPTPIWKLHVTFIVYDPSLERMGSDKKHKRIGSRLLVTVILGSLSERHWPFRYGNCGRRSCGTKATQIFISLTMVENITDKYP
jgi:hypothetical protein